jgi:diguanylate cyclase (GGDEF)-like protein
MNVRFVNQLRSSVSAKIALTAAVPVVIVMLLFARYQEVSEQGVIFRSAETQLLSIAQGLKVAVEPYLKEGDFAGLHKTVDIASRGGDIASIVLVSVQGKVLSSNNKQWIGRTFLEMSPSDLSKEDTIAIQKAFTGGYSDYYDPEDEQYCTVMPTSSGDTITGAILISTDAKSINREIARKKIRDFFIALFYALVLGASIYVLFDLGFARRVKTVSAAALKLAGGDLRIRTDVKGNDEIGYLATSFNVLADEITNWRSNLEEIAASRFRELTALFEVVDTIGKSLDLDKVLPNVLDRVLGSMGTGKGTIVLLDQNSKTLLLKGRRGLSEESVSQIVTKGQGCVGDVILMNRSIQVSGGEDGDFATVPGLESENVRSALVVPITIRGEVLGVLAVYSKEKDRFTDEDGVLLETIGSQVGVAVENARLYEKTLELAQVDGLTGLANRRHLMERLKQERDRAERYHTSLSVIMLDLDKFKSFNDTYGHLLGDELLKAFSAMVTSQIRSADIAGRYGGEEFCVVLPNTSVNGALVIAERVRKAMAEIEIHVGEGRPPAGRTVSIGVAEFTGNESVEKILSAADAALYRAKQDGRNKVAW